MDSKSDGNTVQSADFAGSALALCEFVVCEELDATIVSARPSISAAALGLDLPLSLLLLL